MGRPAAAVRVERDVLARAARREATAPAPWTPAELYGGMPTTPVVNAVGRLVEAGRIERVAMGGCRWAYRLRSIDGDSE